MRRLAMSMTMVALLAGCGAVDSMKEGFRHTGEVASDLEVSVGRKPQVGFNWSNGALVDVSVVFDGVPPGRTNEQIVRLARDSIATRFRQVPRRITVSYVVPGAP